MRRAKWLYINRAFGGDCYRRIIDGNIDASTAAGKKTGQRCCMQK